MFHRIPLLLACFLLLTGRALAQAPASGGNQVDIKQADLLEGTDASKVLTGNVILQQGNVVIYCNKAIQNVLANTLQAYGNVRIVQGDSVTLTGDTALYFGGSRLAKMTGRKVVLNDGTITLTTRRLDYDMNTRVAVYSGGGVILDKKSTLTSRDGTYNTQNKLFTYRNDVRIVNPESVVTADSLRYSSASKEAFFIAPTKIVDKGDTLYAQPGSVYNTTTRTSNFKGRSRYSGARYDLEADTLNYDPPTKIGIAHGNVVFTSRTDSVILTGREGRSYGQTGVTRVWGDAVLRSLRQRDTLYLSSDTLVSREYYFPTDTVRRLFAYRNVLIFKRDFQGKCDSLAYYVNDSTLYFYKKPILWSTGSQSEGDSVQLKLKNGQLQTMILRGRAFVISLDTLRNFNQMKGRRITSTLNPQAKLDRVLVEGNAESIYFALDEKNKIIGMNRVECGRMTLNFKEGEVKRIAFVGKPDASLTPPPKITPANRELDGFNWRLNLRPDRAKVLRNSPPLTTPKLPVLSKPPVARPAAKPVKKTTKPVKPKKRPPVQQKKAS